MRAIARCLSFALLIVGIFVVPVKADTFNFSFSLDQANCNASTSFGLNACSTVVNGSGTFVANPFLQNCVVFPGQLCSTPANGLVIQGLTGELDGSPMTLVPSSLYPYEAVIHPGTNGSVFTGSNPPSSCCYIWVYPGASPLEFSVNGQLWQWVPNDFTGPYDFLDSPGQVVPIKWNITAVPEPSTLLLLFAGLTILTRFNGLKRVGRWF